MATRRAGKQKTYVVIYGRVPGIYETWPECQRQVHGFSGTSYQSFSSRREAEIARGKYTDAMGTQQVVGATPAVLVDAQALIEQKNMQKLHMPPNMGAALEVEDPLPHLQANDSYCTIYVLVLLVCALVFWLCITFMH